LSGLFGYVKFEEKKLEEKPELKPAQVIPLFTGKKEASIARTDTSFDDLVKDIEKWMPAMSYSTEDGYRVDLNAFLLGRGHKTRMEAGDTLVDILVDQKFPIEVKKSPRGGELDREFGQVFRHLDAYNNVIVVVCKPKFLDELNEFDERIQKYAVTHNHPYKMIIKG
jgi:hypothetical protein